MSNSKKYQNVTQAFLKQLADDAFTLGQIDEQIKSNKGTPNHLLLVFKFKEKYGFLPRNTENQ